MLFDISHDGGWDSCSDIQELYKVCLERLAPAYWIAEDWGERPTILILVEKVEPKHFDQAIESELDALRKVMEWLPGLRVVAFVQRATYAQFSRLSVPKANLLLRPKEELPAGDVVAAKKLMSRDQGAIIQTWMAENIHLVDCVRSLSRNHPILLLPPRLDPWDFGDEESTGARHLRPTAEAHGLHVQPVGGFEGQLSIAADAVATDLLPRLCVTWLRPDSMDQIDHAFLEQLFDSYGRVGVVLLLIAPAARWPEVARHAPRVRLHVRYELELARALDWFLTVWRSTSTLYGQPVRLSVNLPGIANAARTSLQLRSWAFDGSLDLDRLGGGRSKLQGRPLVTAREMGRYIRSSALGTSGDLCLGSVITENSHATPVELQIVTEYPTDADWLRPPETPEKQLDHVVMERPLAVPYGHEYIDLDGWHIFGQEPATDTTAPGGQRVINSVHRALRLVRTGETEHGPASHAAKCIDPLQILLVDPDVTNPNTDQQLKLGNEHVYAGFDMARFVRPSLRSEDIHGSTYGQCKEANGMMLPGGQVPTVVHIATHGYLKYPRKISQIFGYGVEVAVPVPEADEHHVTVVPGQYRLEADQDDSNPVMELIELLPQDLPLLVLAACNSLDILMEHDVVQKLEQKNVQWLVLMQELFYVNCVGIFFRRFYRALGEGKDPVAACALARVSTYGKPEKHFKMFGGRYGWGAPVLVKLERHTRPRWWWTLHPLNG